MIWMVYVGYFHASRLYGPWKGMSADNPDNLTTPHRCRRRSLIFDSHSMTALAQCFHSHTQQNRTRIKKECSKKLNYISPHLLHQLPSSQTSSSHSSSSPLKSTRSYFNASILQTSNNIHQLFSHSTKLIKPHKDKNARPNPPPPSTPPSLPPCNPHPSSRRWFQCSSSS